MNGDRSITNLVILLAARLKPSIILGRDLRFRKTAVYFWIYIIGTEKTVRSL